MKFEPKAINAIKKQLENDFPLPSDFALREDGVAYDLIERLRDGKLSFFELSTSDLYYTYQLANLCTDQQFEQLEKVFASRIVSAFYDIGWVYCQYNPDNPRAVSLFVSVCRWMKKNKLEFFNKTLIGHTDLPWDEVYIRSVELMRVKKLSVKEFCDMFNIIENTTFHGQLNMVYLSRCGKEELLANEELLAQLISTSKLELLRPTIKNYTAQIRYEDMSQLINDAITYRLAKESNDESIGLSPNMLQRIRSKRFDSVIEQCTYNNVQKQKVYGSLAGRIKNIELLTGGFFAVDFGNYFVLDNSDWSDYAFAYIPSLYTQLSDEWKQGGYPDNYWPAADENLIRNARDVVLGLKKSDIIKLGFSDFDILYTKDLLSISRY